MRLDTRRPFTRADAVAAGLDPRLLRGSGFRRIFRGVYVDASTKPWPRERLDGALLVAGPQAWLSHASAARAYGVPIPTDANEHVCFATQEQRRSRTGIRSHVDPLDSPLLVDGLRVASPERMFAQLAQSLGIVDLVVVGDSLVRMGRTTPGRLRDALGTVRGTGADTARRAAAHVRDRVDSPMESRLRMLLVLADLPEPVVNHAVRDRSGDVIRRYDLSWPAVRLVVEYDGRHHVRREEQWQRDLDRRAAIDASGWRIIVVTSHGIYADPLGTLVQVHTALRERRLAGTPALLGEHWRPHFPAR